MAQSEVPQVAARAATRAKSTPRASLRLWGLDWRAELPWHVDGYSIEHASFDETMRFVEEHYASVFGLRECAGRFLPSPMTDAKRRFFHEMDMFAFRADDRVVGVAMAHPSDWTTYYVRSIAILPAHRETGLATKFSERIAPPLCAAGVERIEAEISPANTPLVRLFSGHGFVVTGSTSSERWGLVLRYTRFLSDEAREIFVRQYTAMTFAKRSSNPTT
jgi:L-amino acid N-acyltransferase YncA